jgi:hypothetical protein
MKHDTIKLALNLLNVWRERDRLYIKANSAIDALASDMGVGYAVDRIVDDYLTDLIDSILGAQLTDFFLHYWDEEDDPYYIDDNGKQWPVKTMEQIEEFVRSIKSGEIK